MKRNILLAATAVLMLAGPAFAQLPPGKWWRRPQIVANLALTAEQQSKLDEIFRGAANELIDLKGDTEKQSIALRGELDQPQLNRASIQRTAAKLNEARGRLFSRELTMLTDMRGVLTDQQWDRMRAQLDQVGGKPFMQPRPGGERKMGGPRNMGRRGMNGPQGTPPPPPPNE